ncbi:MAG: DUF922 domain-containing protein [Flavobacteriales bacterium]
MWSRLFLLFILSATSPALLSPSRLAMQFEKPADNNLPDTIYWSPDIRLHWVDFRGDINHNSPYSAYTSTIISLKYSFRIQDKKVIPDFQVHAMFNCNKSWARKDLPDRLTDDLLQHEQLHFDLAELVARKLKKALLEQDYTQKNYEFKISAIRKRIITDGDRMQERYDIETGHGSNKKEQQLWIAKVESELNRYSKWR